MLFLVLGLLLPQFFPEIFPWQAALAAAILCGLLAWRGVDLARGAALFCAGLSVASWQIGDLMQTQLSPQWQQQPLWIVAQVLDLPQHSATGARVLLRVEKIDHPTARLPRYIQIFDAQAGFAQRWQAGTRWRLQVKLKPMHGEFNRASFDQESRQITQKILATGSAKHAQFLGDAEDWLAKLQRFRTRLRDFLAQHLTGQTYAGLLIALAMGDQSQIPRAQWQLFQNTGVIHLVSISGVHLTLAAFWATFLTKWMLRLWRVTAVAHRVVMVWVALVFATFYALLAGFSVPTQRSLFMLWALGLSLLWRADWGAWRCLTFAAMVVLVWDNFAVWSVGFWLSFGTVAWMLFAVSGELSGGQNRLRQFWLAQWGAFWATFLPILILFGRVAWLSPVANAYAIPVIGAGATMVVLLASVLAFVLDFPCLLSWAHEFLYWAMQPLTWLAGAPWLSWSVPNIGAALLLFLASLLLVLPNVAGFWLLALVLAAPFFLLEQDAVPAGEVQLQVLDVGQGLAVLIRTQHHVYLYDAGPKFRQADAGARVVLPMLQRAGVRRLDAVMISHDDADHAGGLASIAAALPIEKLFTPDISRLRLPPNAQNLPEKIACQAGQVWLVDGVEFAFLSPSVAPQSDDDDNDFSCVLRVRAGEFAMLLTGDISVKRERELVRTSADYLRSQVLLAAHHGSKTSSSEAFLSAVAPEHIIVSAGFLNAYRHPAPSVWARFPAHAAQRWRTDRDGAITVHLRSNGVQVLAARAAHRRYWFDPEAGSGR